MSSEGSVTSSGSRIRQFGLYRTIDARTEEFLRSSRKRQIRQGCACAAISTAITVTVVVSVILIYEYSVNSESNVNKKISLRPNWLGSMNESDVKSFDSKFTKKINFDRTTLKLLPILLKALNKNRYLEKILEDYSSSSPPYLGIESTETSFKRNVFSDSKNWLKIPSSKLYTIDYKTSPLLYWKNPTKRLEYLSKVRKIRDYQRMLNYFDKMINEKVGSNQRREYEYTENPFMAEAGPVKDDKINEISQTKSPLEKVKNGTELKNNVISNSTNCKCPKKFGLMLTKLMANIQNMIPKIITHKLATHKCRKNESTTYRTVQQTRERAYEPPTTVSIGSSRKTARKLLVTKLTNRPFKATYFTKRKPIASCCQKTSTSPTTISTASTTTINAVVTTEDSLRREKGETGSDIYNVLGGEDPERTTKSTTESATESSTTGSTTMTSEPTTKISMIPNTATTPENIFFDKYFHNRKRLPIITTTLQPIYQYYEKNTLDYDSIVKPTDKPYIETTRNPGTKPTTEMFIPIKFIDSSNEVASTEKFFETYTVEPTQQRSTIPLFREEEYDDYFFTTPKNSNELGNLDINSLQLVKTQMMSPTTRINDLTFNDNLDLKKMYFQTKSINYRPGIQPSDLDLSSMRQMADMIYIPRDQIAKETGNNLKVDPEYSVIPYKNDYLPDLKPATEKAFISNYVESNTSVTSNSTSTKYTSSIKNSIHITDTIPEIKNETTDTKPSGDQGNNIENLAEEDFQEDYGFKQIDSTTRPPYKYKNTTKRINTIMKSKEDTLSSWDLLKNEEKLSLKLTSMIPSMRPLYLDVHRNSDWRQDDHPDYDINFNNNIFDLPNI